MATVYRLGSVADDQMEAGRDEFGFDLDNAQDLFVYTGTGRWSVADTLFGDTISGFQDGSDLFDMRAADFVLRPDDRQRRFPDDGHIRQRDDHDLREFWTGGLYRSG